MAIDLFGLGKSQEPAPEETPEPQIAPELPAPPRGSHRLWAFLLVLDSAFLIVFAGGVAMKVYQYWRVPAAPVATPRRRTPKEPPKAPEADAPAPASTAAAPAPVAAPAPAPAAAPKTAPAAEKSASRDLPGRPPKPSLLADAPRHRATPGLAEGGASAPVASPASGTAPKAMPVEFKLRAPRAKEVWLVGAFIVRGGRKEMLKHSDGTWTITLYLTPGQYRYFFSVDKKKQTDPENPRSDRGASVLSVP